MSHAQPMFDVVLLDISLPDVEGLQVASQIREMTAGKRRPRVISVSANTPKEERELREWRACGIDATLPKPNSRLEVLDAMWQVLSVEPGQGNLGRTRAEKF